MNADYTDEQWHQVTGVNLDGVFFTQRAAIRAMRHGGRGGSIINMASILGAVGFASASAYTAAKHGVGGLTQAAAGESHADQSRITAAAPPRRRAAGEVGWGAGRPVLLAQDGDRLATVLRLTQSSPNGAVGVFGARSNAGRFMESQNLFNWATAKAQTLFAAKPAGTPQPQE